MAVRLTCTDNASGHDGLRWRMGEPPGPADIPLGETAPGVSELLVSSPLEPEACFSVAAYSGNEESPPASVCADTVPPADLSTAAIGDEIEGGIYAGIITYADARQFYIIAGKQADQSELSVVDGGPDEILDAQDEDDGMSNTLAMVGLGTSTPGVDYVLSFEKSGFTDWYMPALNEGELIKNNLVLTAHPEFLSFPSSVRRSSTDRPAWPGRSWSIRWEDGQSGVYYRNAAGWVIPIRRVPV